MKRCSPSENSLALPQNVQHRFPAGPSSVTPTYTPEKNENLCPAPNSHKHIGSWQKVEATQMSISGCIEKRNLVYLHKGTWKLAKRKKLVPKEQILIYYLIPLIWHMADRNYTSSYPAPELERQMADRYSGSCRGSENVLKLTVVMVVHFRGHTKNHWPLTCILPFFFSMATPSAYGSSQASDRTCTSAGTESLPSDYEPTAPQGELHVHFIYWFILHLLLFF